MKTTSIKGHHINIFYNEEDEGFNADILDFKGTPVQDRPPADDDPLSIRSPNTNDSSSVQIKRSYRSPSRRSQPYNRQPITRPNKMVCPQ